MTTTIDEELTEMVADLRLRFTGVDDGVLTYAPVRGASVDDAEAAASEVAHRLESSDVLERIGIPIYGLRIEPR